MAATTAATAGTTTTAVTATGTERKLIRSFRAGFPDLEIRPVDVLILGDRAAWRVEGTGTHTGEFMGIPPTGRTVRFAGVDMGTLQDGKAHHHWSGADTLGMLQQLGVVPGPAPAP